MKVTIVPQNQDQLQDWQNKLNEAKAPYQLVSKRGKVAIELEDYTAERVLGVKPKKKTPVWKYALYALAGLFVLGLLLPDGAGDVSSPAASAPAEPVKDSLTLRKEMIERQFSGWDGSHKTLTLALKKVLNDPKSYEHVQTTYFDMKDHLVVKTTYRANNAFGAKVLNQVTAKVDLKGNIIEVVNE